MQHTLQIVGLAANLLGTIIASLSAGLYFKLVDTSITALEMTVHSDLDQSQVVPVITGLDKHRRTAMRRNGVWIWIGLFLIIVGFALQIIDLFTTPTAATPTA